MDKIWKLLSYAENEGADFLDKLMAERGINSQQEKEIYLSSDLKYLSDPFLLPEMDEAVKRIKKAVKNDENILIYGDYDVDGITSTSLLYRFFQRAFSLKVSYFLPDRIEDGYGLNLKALKEITAKNIDLIISVDCGITAYKEAEYLKEVGVDLIITDHHTPSEKLPQAEAVINHHLVDQDNYSASEIAGVGTAFKLAEALNSQLVREMKADLLPIAALGTVADIAPLKDENRILVKNGLELIKEDKIKGLKILIEELKLDKENISAGQIGYIIAPPLNAAGRIHDAEEALKLLIYEDEAELREIARKLIKINKKRQQEEEKIYKSAEKKIKNIDLEEEKSIILADSDWHSGIIGIVASRLLEKYNLPVILFAVDQDNNTAKGSARSISALNIYQALKYCQSELISFGGHRAAAGLSIQRDKINEFRLVFKKYLTEKLEAEDFLKSRKIDINYNLKDLSKAFIQTLEKFRPFGIANPAPKFLFQNLDTKKSYQMGKENKHLKIYLENGIQAVAFNLGDELDQISKSRIDLIAQPEINRWRGKENIQLKVDDYRSCSDFSTALVFEKDNYSIYDYRNSEDKFNILNKLLTNKVINKAAVYVNQKNEKNHFKENNKNHYFFGNKLEQQDDFSHLILYSLPFSFNHFHSILKEFERGSSRESNKIILLFSNKDIKDNSRLIEYLNQQEITANKENELDFKGSVRYNKLSRRMENFMIFKDLIFKENLFDLIANVSNFKEDKNES
jgi:single-stranded-DNA-specific exonuclease